MDLIEIVKIVVIMLIFIIFCLIVFLVYFMIKDKQSDSKSEIENSKNDKSKDSNNYKPGIDKDSVFNFMEFDDIKDNMIIRKNRSQYVMVIRCKGGNYDLMSEEEKVSVEAGFVQFLNTLRAPIQLYVQTTSLNLKDIIEEYTNRIENMQKEIRAYEQQIKLAKSNGDVEKVKKLNYEKRKKENVYEYTVDIAEYIARMSTNRNILQQKTYVIISYYAAETDNRENLSQDELDEICFSELYTRTQTTIRSLSSAGVTGRILTSEELSELLYVAYNRDESEIVQLSKALNAEYDALYSTSKDVLVKKQEMLNDAIETEAVDMATESIKKADEILKRKRRVVKKANEIVDEYRGEMSNDLYYTTKEVIKKSAEENK